MVKMIACCGLDCCQCLAFIATQANDQEGLAKTAAKWSKMFGTKIEPKEAICDGCTPAEGEKASYCNVCEIRSCCLEKNRRNCAFCEEYICEKLEKFFKDAPEAKENLEKIKQKA